MQTSSIVTGVVNNFLIGDIYISVRNEQGTEITHSSNTIMQSFQDSKISILYNMFMENPWSHEHLVKCSRFEIHSDIVPDMSGGGCYWVSEESNALLFCAWLREKKHQAVLIWDMAENPTCQWMIWSDNKEPPHREAPQLKSEVLKLALGSNKKVDFKCDVCFHVFSLSVRDVTCGGRWCGMCSSKKQ